MNVLNKLWKDEEGQDLVEYGLLIALVALGAIAGMQTLADGINDVFSNVASNLTANS